MSASLGCASTSTNGNGQISQGKRICREEHSVGSNIPQTVCWTEQEAADRAQADQQELRRRDMLNRPGARNQ